MRLDYQIRHDGDQAVDAQSFRHSNLGLEEFLLDVQIDFEC